jgi:hypothetical protein
MLMADDARLANVTPLLLSAQLHSLADQVSTMSSEECEEIAHELRNIITIVELRIEAARRPGRGSPS